MVKLIVAACVLTACVSYDASFEPCTVHCTDATSEASRDPPVGTADRKDR